MSSRILGLTLATAVLLPPGLALAQAAGPDQPAASPAASSAPAASASAPDAQAPTTPPASPPPAAAAAPAAAGAPIPVALVITPEFKAVVWSHASELMRPMYLLGDVNNLGKATSLTLEQTLKAMGLDVHVVESADEAQRLSAISYVLTPTIQRFEEHNKGLTTFAPFEETIVVQWKVVDAKGNTVLLDTALATAIGKLGNNFVAAEHAKAIEKKMLADLQDKSTALLHPVLVNP
jgi:hypothetical protein